MVKVLLIDNYDSFTYNLAQLLEQSGLCTYDVKLNDKFILDEVASYDKILISPGPGLPAQAGMTCEVIRTYASSKPILGICLGHQAIAEVFGARLFQMTAAQHGQAVEVIITDNEDTLFRGLPHHLTGALYHSWSVERHTLTPELGITAELRDGSIMGLRHKSYPVRGLQFHPESVATEYGMEIIRNWLQE